MQNDSEKYTDELLSEYFKLIDLPDRPEYALRVREIMAELRKRTAEGRPGPKGQSRTTTSLLR
jgi:hypothetical protein